MPEYDSPGSIPGPDEGQAKEDFLALYPEHEALSDMYWPEDEEG